MPVNLTSPAAHTLLPIKGVKLGFAEAFVRKPNRKDVLVVTLSEGTSVSGVFTKNQFCAAPVLLCKEHLTSGQSIRALLVNTGCANAGTGEDGMQRAALTCKALASALDIQAKQVLQIGRAHV